MNSAVNSAVSSAVSVAVLVLLIGRPALADPVTSTTSTTSTTTAPSRTGSWVIVSGRGFGHGVGMAQDGAYWMSRQGRSSAEILRLFYPGTTLGRHTGDVRVPLAGGARVVISLPNGGTVAGRRIDRGATVTVSPQGSGLIATFATIATGPGPGPGPALAMTPIAFREQTPDAASGDNSPSPSPPASAPPNVDAGPEPTAAPTPASIPAATPAATSSLAPPPVEPAPEPSAPTPTDAATTTEATGVIASGRMVVEASGGTTLLYGGRPYRGRLELRSQGGVGVVNELDVEQYLRGMAEITDSGWPQAALEAQAIAARTYAFRTMAAAGEVCPTQRCQVYVGAKAEYPAMDKAVAATQGKVVTYAKGKLAVTFYSASGGGTMATPEEAFGGGGDFPYLQAGTYPTGDVKSWVVSLTLAELGRRVGYRGIATDVSVTKVGPSGRAVDVTVSGSAGTLVVPGPKFDAALGLRSTFFTLQRATSAAISDDVVPLASSVETTSETSLEFSQSDVFAARLSVVPSDTGRNVASTDVTAESGVPALSTSTSLGVSVRSAVAQRGPRRDVISGSRVDTSHHTVEAVMIGALMVILIGPITAVRRHRNRKRSAR